ncbi:MAG: hypothetical protein KAI24_00945 [Planctomycetes bacterium]|nr:hypothetical protein [Planctomycetota bacterium]
MTKDTPAADKPTVIPVSTPKIEALTAEPQHWYWIGLLPDSPRSCVHVCGLAFQKVTETIHKVPHATKQQRFQHPGIVLKLTESKLRELAETLPRKVMRTRVHNSGDEGSVDTVLGFVVTIPTDEQLEARTGERSPRYRRFVPQAGDRPLAELLYIEPVEDPHPAPRDMNRDLPKPVSEVGIRVSAAAACRPGEILHGAGNVLASRKRGQPRGEAKQLNALLQ